MIDQAFILAAGFATRMRPLTDNLPKPLVIMGGKPLLTHIVEKLVDVGVKHIVMNGFHAIDKMEEYLPIIQKTYPDVTFALSKEADILETGGGAVQALGYLDQTKPFYMINGDAYWVDTPNQNTLKSLAASFVTSDNDMTLLLQSVSSMQMTEAKGDYSLENGQAIRSHDKNGTYMFTGVRVLKPSVLDGYEVKKYSFLKNMDACEAAQKLGGHHHEGQWYHISTPQDLYDVNSALFAKVS